MAKVIYSPLVSSLSGRLGSVVAQNGPGGAMLRALSGARPRRSPALQAAQSALGAASAAWRALSADERAFWAAIARAYDPAGAGSGLAFSLGRQQFIAWHMAHAAFLLTAPSAPARYPWGPVFRPALFWDPDTNPDLALTVGCRSRPVQTRITLQLAPFWPQYSSHQPWRQAFNSATDGALVWTISGDGYYTTVPIAPFLKFERFGVTSLWVMRITILDELGTILRADDGYASLVFP